MYRVLVVGGGFGGLRFARDLRGAPVDLTLVDRRNFHLFQPLLYQVATGGLSPANIAVPLRAILRRQKNVRVLLGEVTGFDVQRKEIVLAGDPSRPVGEERLGYDTLVVATGATHSYFGKREWEPYAPGLKTIEDATGIRARVLKAFEQAERETDPQRLEALLGFVVVGAGPTGVELAGALSEIARHTLRKDFHDIDPASARVLLVEAGPRVLPAYPEDLSTRAERFLRELGVEVRAGTQVTDIDEGGVVLESERAREEWPARTVLWAAGVQASPLGKALAEATGAGIDRSGRVEVQPDLSLPGHDEIFVVGDLAHREQDGRLLPGIAPVAMQQGSHVARVIRDRLAGRATPPFRYRDRGMLATIGRSRAVAVLFGRHLAGAGAWILWLVVHLMQLVMFQNRLLVLLQWGWNYFTYNRAARLITGEKERSRML